MPDKMTPAEEAAFINLNDERTPGEWKSCAPTRRGSFTFGGNELVAVDGTVIVQWNGFDSADGTKSQKQVNSRFIAACSVMVPKLLATIRAQRELLKDALNEGFARHAEGCSGGLKEYFTDKFYPCKCGFIRWSEKTKEVQDGNPEQG